MKKAWLFASVAALLMVGLPTGAGALHAPTAQAKKKCKIVIKIVHGKKRKVRVCHTVKPKPKPKPTVKNVSISLDKGKAATQTIGAQGGSVTATAANGTTYTLVLPAGALVAPTEVQVIPVKSVAGLGGHARVVGGVQLEPEGLGLFKPATLTITASSLTSKPTQAFSWYGAGRTFGRYPSTRTGTRLEFQLAHFSGDGVAQGESTDWSRWQSIQDALRAHYQQSTRPLMTQAETDDSVFVRALQDYLGWEAELDQLELNDFMAQEREGLAKSADKAFRNYVDKASGRCVNQHKLGEIAILESAARQAYGLGDKQLSNEILTKAKKCGHFDLDYETVMTRTDAPLDSHWSVGKSVSHVRVLGLQLDLAEGDVSGEKQIEYLSWSYNVTASVPGGALCTFSEDGIELGTPFRVTSLEGMLPTLKAVAGPDGRPQFDPPSISLSVFPGEPAEWVKDTCTPGGVVARLKHNRYTGIFDGLYAAQADSPDGLSSFRIDGWDFLGGSVYARKTYQRSKDFSVGGISWTENEQTTYVLRHTPQ